ncbi:MAG: ParB N-terminal domain-containing protein [Planctomycetes bacterium]|nr:ParB N-terminal domain-containing protein [Planctomycetota bacterium]
MQIELRPIDQVIPYDRNPRQNESAVDAVVRSITDFGFRQPIVVDTNGVIVVGHTRLKAAQKLGLSEVPVHVAHELTPEQAKAYRIADNQTANLATWDLELLKTELTDLKALDVDLNSLGFSDVDLSRLMATDENPGLTDPNAIPEPPEAPITQAGDLWLLGEHRLSCGDSTSAADVQRLMNGKRAALFSTDPPYLIDYDGTNHPHKWGEKDKNKNWSDTYGVTWDDADANPDLYDKFIATAVAEAIQPNAAWYCWHASRRQALLESIWTKHGAFVHQQIIWNKDRPILTRSWYMWQHEPCFFGWVRPNRPTRYAVDHPHSVWNIPTIPAGQKTDHPTSKPVELFAIPMRQHTKAGDICYEPFSGSGSQIIAAEQLSRRCYAMEISPVYCDVAIKRWESFTGRKAKLTHRSNAPDSAEALEVNS